MDSSLFKMIIFLCLFFSAWIVFILLSTCMGPSIFHLLRSFFGLDPDPNPRHPRSSSSNSRGSIPQFGIWDWGLREGEGVMRGGR
ncbi:BZ3500_MvSof-1268-A1-R1_Chr5-2g07748 [Microbotryum saponariae]|uniref:BZ3500_MvSof-1268-A1-R1_Chr5-2g07748 protein n=1 Tax=Microbotryum saponariae TaxID=289078 RepID=A0A2X0KHY9_9BASI|nr:BZ3500_MvSof-1268-A1-R1_Chr5-2g07748 [Microbotryum saponariae]